MHAAADEAELAPDDLATRRALEQILEVAQRLAVEPRGERAHPRPVVGDVDGDEGDVDAQDRGESRTRSPKTPSPRRRHGQRGGTQRILDPLAIGDVGRDAAYGVGAAAGVLQRELVRQVGARPTRRHDRLLEVDRAAFLDDAAVVAAEFGRRRGKDLGVGATEIASGESP